MNKTHLSIAAIGVTFGVAASGVAACGFKHPQNKAPLAHYKKEWIPLVYEDLSDFRSFIEQNKGKKVKVNSALALDKVLPINYLVHQVCEMQGPDHDASANQNTIYSFGMPRFAKGFDAAELDNAKPRKGSEELVFSAETLAQVSCPDTLRIELLDPANFRWSYGGTGTQSLPLSGTFKVTARALSGPSFEYTLRQIEE